MPDLLKKLNEVLEKDKSAEMAEDAPKPAAEEPEDDQVRKVRKAEEQVAYLSELFYLYVSENVMLEHPELFAVERLGYREASRRSELFGVLKSSAEHRVVAVTFKTNFLLFVRFSAVILSRELDVVATFCKRGQEAKAVELSLDLLQYREGPSVDWRKAFETIFVRFLEWYEARV